MALLEWFANNYKQFGTTLEIVTDKSQEGAQFVKGFGGVGGILRYQIDLQTLSAGGTTVDELQNDLDDFNLDDY
jgi:peptide chain release factor subunit 1